MTATYNTVSVGGTEYDVYAAIADANSYLEAEVSAAATKWRSASLTDNDTKARALVSATRLIDRQSWPGSKTDGDYQTLEWPRKGTGITGVDQDVIPQQIIDACILLAAEINNGSKVTSESTTDSRTKRLKAGSVEKEFFRELDGGTRFPTAIEELLRGLRGGVGLSGVVATGTDTCSDFRDRYEPRVP